MLTLFGINLLPGTHGLQTNVFKFVSAVAMVTQWQALHWSVLVPVDLNAG